MLGKLLLTIDSLLLLFAAPIADYNHTHIFNPRWTPHAKFHGAQTIVLSVTLGVATLCYTWRASFISQSTPVILARKRKEDDLRTAAVTGSIYWLAGLAAILFPGTDGVDPEFGPSGFPQGPLFSVFALIAILGSFLEMSA